MATEVERLRYYERQFLGATDFNDEQNYHRDSLRRHLLGPHTWGIVTGLELSTAAAESGQGVDVTIECGLAVDAFGRTIALLDQTALAKDQFEALADQTNTQWVDVGLRYVEQTTGQPSPGFETCATGGDECRIVETYAVQVNTPGQIGVVNNDVTVAGQPLDPANAVADYSIPHQELPDDATPRWIVPLGRVQWQPSADPTVAGSFLAADAQGRVYGGAVAASLLAPDGSVVVRGRADAPASPAPTQLLAVEGTLGASGLLTASGGLDVTGATDITGEVAIAGDVEITGGLQVELPSSSDEAVVGVAKTGGGIDPTVTIAGDGTVTVAGQVAIGASSPGSSLLAVSAPGAAAVNEFTIASSGDTQVGGKLVVNGTLDVNSSLSIHDASGGDDTDPFVLSRHQRATDQNDLRVQIGDNLDGLDRFVVGPVYYGDGQFKEQFVVDNLGNLNAAGSLNLGADLAVTGSLRVTGSNNLIVAFTEELSVVMGPADEPVTWTVNHPVMFAAVYARFAVWNGFSIWPQGSPGAWQTFTGHAANANAIPQHVFVRVTDSSSTEYTSGVGYVSESDAANEHDNSALFTVVVLGRGS